MTAAQTAANQANAQNSTGPRSVEGKARVAQNALRHGLTARHLFARDDEQHDLALLRDELLAELDPQGAIETITFNELLHAAWNLHRFRRIEAEVSSGTAADFAADTATVLDRLGRYQARVQRAYYRALQELRTLQTNRALRAAKLDDETEPEVPVITDINQLTKQTHSEVTAEAIKQAINMLEAQTGILRLDAFRRHAESAATKAAEKAPQVSSNAAGPAPAAAAA